MRSLKGSAPHCLPAPASRYASVRPSSTSSSTPIIDKSHHVLSYEDSAFPSGFSVAACHSGVKKSKPGALDLGLLVSHSECSAAACFTRNVFKAAPVQVSTEVLASGNGKVRGLIVNSGCANAVTGKQGIQDAKAMSDMTTKAVRKKSESSESSAGTLVMSTGVIGQHLPIDSITSAIPKLASELSSSASAWLGLAKAFMTTDTFPKLRARTFKLSDDGPTYRLAGIDKGAGMIHPNMGPPHGTLLGVIATDAPISPKALQSALTHAVDRSFNSISVDGDMSTNDTIIALANGSAGGQSGGEITEQTEPEQFARFRTELTEFAEELAKLVVRDGEGATKFVTVKVKVSVRGRIAYLAPEHLHLCTECTELRSRQKGGCFSRNIILVQDSDVRRRCELGAHLVCRVSSNSLLACVCSAS